MATFRIVDLGLFAQMLLKSGLADIANMIFMGNFDLDAIVTELSRNLKQDRVGEFMQLLARYGIVKVVQGAIPATARTVAIPGTDIRLGV